MAERNQPGVATPADLVVPQDTPAVGYACQRRRPPVTRPLARIALVLLPFLFVFRGLECENRWESCANCGAEHVMRGAWVFGIGGRYVDSVREGPLSKAIQACAGSPCPHRWETFDGDRSHPLLLLAPMGSRAAGYRVAHVRTLENLADLETLVRTRCDDDPEFIHTLQDALAKPRERGSHAFVWGLVMDDFNRNQSRSAPATAAASQPAP